MNSKERAERTAARAAVVEKKVEDLLKSPSALMLPKAVRDVIGELSEVVLMLAEQAWERAK